MVDRSNHEDPSCDHPRRRGERRSTGAPASWLAWLSIARYGLLHLSSGSSGDPRAAFGPVRLRLVESPVVGGGFDGCARGSMEIVP